MAKIIWLHLSDWHQKGKDFDREVVRDSLISDIKHRKTISPDLEKVDFIVFSGDVAATGKKEEYLTAVKEFFDPLLKATDLNTERLFIVPGNHDLERIALDLIPGNLLSTLNSPARISEWLTNERKRRVLMTPMENYTEFIGEYIGKSTKVKEPAYGNVYRFTLDGYGLGIIGLNSAWFCAQHKELRDGEEDVNDYGYLLLGEPQIYEALGLLSFA